MLMKMRYTGNAADLRDLVRRCGVRGEWRFIETNGLHQFKAVTGENLNWWPSTGTINFQGGDEPILAKRFARRLGQEHSTRSFCPERSVCGSRGRRQPGDRRFSAAGTDASVDGR